MFQLVNCDKSALLFSILLKEHSKLEAVEVNLVPWRHPTSDGEVKTHNKKIFTLENLERETSVLKEQDKEI